MAFTINKNLVFFDSNQAMNSSLEKLVKNLSDNDFKYLSEEFNPKLKMTEIKLELISDIDKYFFVEKGLRGEISYISKRFSEQNNKCMKIYDSKKESKYIIDLDANN